MPFRDAPLLLQDILDAISDISRFTEGLSLDTFRTDSKTVAAVERKLLLISEAAIRLGEQAETLCPGQPWRNIRGIGNWLRHQYDFVDLETIWRTVTGDLPSLQSAVSRALSEQFSTKG